ncbi:MAG TPA: DUF1302 domain-containing protein [Steroidobacteraceae bacterium]|jgi:hypothetical protein
MSRRSSLLAAAATCLATLICADAQAISFQSASGDWSGSWDTTIGYGQGWRATGRNCQLIATADGGCGYSPNIDDGDLNYGKGTFSQAFTGVTELSLKYKEKAGLFVRASGLYDVYVMGDHTQRTPLSHDARDLVGSYTRLLDAFGYYRFDLGSMPSEFRFGRQVVSWGESTFIPGGLNEVNHYDVSALLTPGSELKQALLPDTMGVFNLQLTKNVSSQLLYLFDWHETLAPPTGSYFGTSDAGVVGGNHLYLGFGAISDQGVNFGPLGGPTYSDFQSVNRLPDHKPPDSGQYGVNLKFYLPNLGQGTQIGLYFLNYTSRLPVLDANTGTQAGLGNAFGAVNAVGGAAQALAAGLPFAAAVATGAAVGQQRAAAVGGNLSAAAATQYATIGANTLLAGGNVNSQAQSIATYEYGKTAGYFEEFPQDIKMIGASFNGEIKATGTAIQGELAFRHNVPLQLDDVELLYATLTPFEAGIAGLLSNGAVVPHPGTCPKNSPTPVSDCNQFGVYGLGRTIRGWELKNTWHGAFTATQTFANVLGASQAVLVGEAAADYIPGLENKYTGGPEGFGLRYDGPGTNLSGNPNLGGYPQYPSNVEPGSAFPDKFSWGYVLAGRLEYANLIGAWDILPHLTWSQDVKGVSPGPGGNFIQGRHAVTVGVGADLQKTWDLDVSYTRFGGAGQYNLLGDRSFVAASIKFSF